MNTYEIKLLHVMCDGQRVDTVRLERAHTAEDALAQVRVNIIARQAAHTKTTVTSIRPWEGQVTGLCNALGMSGGWTCGLRPGHEGNHSPYDEDGKVPPKGFDYYNAVFRGCADILSTVDRLLAERDKT